MVVPPKFIYGPCNIITDVLTLLLLNIFRDLEQDSFRYRLSRGHATASQSNCGKVFVRGHYNRDHFEMSCQVMLGEPRFRLGRLFRIVHETPSLPGNRVSFQLFLDEQTRGTRI